MKRILLLILLAILIFVQPSSAQDNAIPKKLKVGIVLGLSGDAAMTGVAIRQGIELARDQLKAKGWQVELDWQDTESKPTKAISSIQYLASKGFRLFVGPTWSYEINSVKPILEQSGSLTLVPAGSSDINGGPSKSIFNLCPIRSKQTAALVEWLKSKTFKKAYILVPSGDWGLTYKKVYLEALKNHGLTDIAIDEYDYGWPPSSLKSLLLRQKANQVDLILTTGAAGDIANLLKIRKELHWTAGFVATEDLWDAIDMGLISAAEPELHSAWVLGLPLSKTFFDNFEKQYRETPKVYADRGYDALMLLAKAVQFSGSESTSVAKFFSGLKDYKGGSGLIEFNSDGDRTSGIYKVMDAFDNKSRS